MIIKVVKCCNELLMKQFDSSSCSITENKRMASTCGKDPGVPVGSQQNYF